MALLLMLGLMSLCHVSVVRGSHLWAASPRYMASVVCVVHGFVDDVSQSAWQRTG